MIEITSAAQKKLRDCLKQNPGMSPRISFSEGGLMGPALKLSFENPQEGDIAEDIEDFHINIAQDVSYFANKMIIDLGQNGKDGNFEIEAQEGMICNEDCASCQGCPT